MSWVEVNNVEMEAEDLIVSADKEIISFVRANPLLWQKCIKLNKKDRDIISQAFSQIGSLLSKPLTGDAVSTRWKSLRDQFSRETRKVTASQPRSVAGSDELSYKPTWPLFNEMLFLKDVIKPRKTQSNINKKKLKLCRDTQINDSPFEIVIPSSITRTPKNTEEVMWRSNQLQVIEEVQLTEESQVIEETEIIEKIRVEEEINQDGRENQMIEKNVYQWNAQVEDTFKKSNSAVVESFDDVPSVHSSSMSTCGSQSPTVPPPDSFFTKKKAAVEQVHSIIKNTAAKINSVCDTIGINFTPERTLSTEEDSAIILIKSFLKKVPSNMKIKCLSDIMVIIDKYSSNVSE